MRLGIDVMGGDLYPHAPIAGVKRVQPDLGTEVEIVLVGQEEVIKAELEQQGLASFNYPIVHAAEVVGMSEHPAKAIQGKPNSSISVGLDLVKSGQLDGFISMGNTGAMTAGAVLKLGLMPGLARPTIGAFYPKSGQYSLIADVGLNTDCKPEQLQQFALLGSVFMQTVMHVERPRVALLNVGEEKSKGNQAAQQAYALLEADPRIHFIGNAEGRDLEAGKADVYICDGFTGNILLKFAESLYHFMHQKLPNDPDVEALNFEAIGGLPLLGVGGVVMVGHGISGPEAYRNVILRAAEVVRTGLIGQLQATFTGALAQ
ncbi:MAG: phosphate--acyl-ACP acyltransferase [Bacteroidia bacterium]|nr:phosphate--acyl-ACP acyltransferase [Bacteroidia bacterium]